MGSTSFTFDGFDRRTGSNDCRLSSPNSFATRWLFVCFTAEHSESHSFISASLFETTRHQPTTRSWRRQTGQEKVQAISDWLFSYWHCRSEHRRRAALLVRRHRLAPRNSLMPNCIRIKLVRRLANFYGSWSKSFLIVFTRFWLTTASNLPIVKEINGHLRTYLIASVTTTGLSIGWRKSIIRGRTDKLSEWIERSKKRPSSVIIMKLTSSSKNIYNFSSQLTISLGGSRCSMA